MPEDPIALVMAHLDERSRFLAASAVSPLWRRVALRSDIPLLDLTLDGFVFGPKFAPQFDVKNWSSRTEVEYVFNYKLMQKQVGEFFKKCPLKIQPRAVLGIKAANVEVACLEALAAFMPRLRSITVVGLTEASSSRRFNNEALLPAGIEPWKYVMGLRYLTRIHLTDFDGSIIKLNSKVLLDFSLVRGSGSGSPYYLGDFAFLKDAINLERLDSVYACTYGDFKKKKALSIPLNVFSNLKSLTVPVYVKDCELVFGCDLPHLESLEATFINSFNGHSGPVDLLQSNPLFSLSKYPKLRRISFSGHPIVLSKGLMGDHAFEEVHLLTAFPGNLAVVASQSPSRLLRLSIALDPKIGESEIQMLGKLTSLTGLDVRGLFPVDHLIKQLLKLKLLQRFALSTEMFDELFASTQFSSNPFPDYQTAASLVHALPRHCLRQLYLRDLPLDAKVLAALVAFPSLEVLDVIIVSKQRFLGEWLLELSKLGSLEKLYLDQRQPNPPNELLKTNAGAMYQITIDHLATFLAKASKVKSITLGSGIVLGGGDQAQSTERFLRQVANAHLPEQFHVDIRVTVNTFYRNRLEIFTYDQ